MFTLIFPFLTIKSTGSPCSKRHGEEESVQPNGLPEAVSRGLRTRSAKRPAPCPDGSPSPLLRAAAPPGRHERLPRWRGIPRIRSPFQAQLILHRHPPGLRRALQPAKRERGLEDRAREDEDEDERDRKIDGR